MLLTQAILSAASVGIGCGAGCGSAASAFLTTYILSEGKKLPDAARQVATFYLGKLLSVVCLCMGGSLLGRRLISESGLLAGFPLQKIISCMILLSGVWLIRDWFRRRKGCAACSHCRSNKRLAPSFAVGAAYGLSPCAPLFIILGYSIAFSLPGSVILAVVFSLSSSLIPAILTFTIAGALSVNLSAQLGKYLPWFQLIVYSVYFAAGLAGVIGIMYTGYT